jgi:hypothetical protein
MSMFKYETRTRQGSCPSHGHVKGEKQVPKVTFPFVITGVARGVAGVRLYRCPECGAKVS